MTGGADTQPGGNMGKGMGTFSQKQAKYGFPGHTKPDAKLKGVPAGKVFNSSYRNSGEQI